MGTTTEVIGTRDASPRRLRTGWSKNKRCAICGISGYIGESKNAPLTYQLITKLLEKSESRGVDAAGYWATEGGTDGRVLYHKEPGRSSVLVKKDVWKQVAGYDTNLFLAHARGASKGVGEPAFNHNNHPFTSSDKSLALIHNGRVDELEYQTLKKKYGLLSQCDSEIILRIFEGGETYTAAELSAFNAARPHRLAGIRDVFSYINEGHMAVAVGERGEFGERFLWLFRNRHRPLWVVDMREGLGQVFFVSDPNIWEEAVYETPATKVLNRTQKLIELPPEEVWHFNINPSNTQPQGVERYEVQKKNLSPWRFDGNRVVPPKRTPKFEVVTQLDENDGLLSKNKLLPKVLLDDDDDDDDIPIRDVHQKCHEIKDLVENIRTYADQLVEQKSVSKIEMQQLLESLERQRLALMDLTFIMNI